MFAESKMTKGPFACVVAPIYRAFAHRNFRRVGECDTLLRWLAARPSERVLDVGCGDGHYDRQIARSGAHVVGIDIHETRLAIARAFNETPLTEYLHMDAEEMAFPDASFDKAISFCVIEHFHRDEQVLSHIHRVLKPGGTLVLSADSLSNPGITQEERSAHQRRYAVNNFYTAEVLERKLDAAGFDVVDTHYVLTTPVTLALIRLSWKLDDLPTLLAPVRSAGHLLLATVGKLASDLAERLDYRLGGGLTLLAKAKKRLPVI